MRDFRFRFQPLLATRKQTRDQCRVELAEASQAEQQARQRRHEVETKLAGEHERARAGKAAGPLDAEQLAVGSRYAAQLRTLLAENHSAERAAAAHACRAHEALVEADRGVRVLEKLRERQLEQFERQRRSHEMKELDEIAGQLDSQAA